MMMDSYSGMNKSIAAQCRMSDAYANLWNKNKQLESEISQFKAERDAAVADFENAIQSIDTYSEYDGAENYAGELLDYRQFCNYCVYYTPNDEYICSGTFCDENAKNFKWRGVKEDDDNEC